MFSPEELAYLRGRPLARLATLNAGEQPDVVSVAFEVDETGFWVGGGATVGGTRRARRAGYLRADHSRAFVELEPRRAACIGRVVLDDTNGPFGPPSIVKRGWSHRLPES